MELVERYGLGRKAAWRISKLNLPPDLLALMIAQSKHDKAQFGKGRLVRERGTQRRGFPRSPAKPRAKGPRCIFCAGTGPQVPTLTRLAHRACMDRVTRARNQAWQKYERGEA